MFNSVLFLGRVSAYNGIWIQVNLTTPRVRNAFYKISYPPKKKFRGKGTSVVKSENVDIQLEIRIELLSWIGKFVFVYIKKIK